MTTAADRSPDETRKRQRLMLLGIVLGVLALFAIIWSMQVSGSSRDENRARINSNQPAPHPPVQAPQSDSK